MSPVSHVVALGVLCKRSLSQLSLIKSADKSKGTVASQLGDVLFFTKKMDLQNYSCPMCLHADSSDVDKYI